MLRRRLRTRRRPLTDLRGIPGCPSHDSILSRNGVSGNPGAIQWDRGFARCEEPLGSRLREKLADLAGVHRTYVGRLERGESGVTVEKLAAILAALPLSLAEFFAPFQQRRRPPRTPRQRT